MAKMAWMNDAAEIGNFIDTYALSAVTYVFIAGISAGVEWSTFFAVKAMGVFKAAIIAFFVATLANYVLSRGVAFKSKRPHWEEIGLLFALSALAFLFNLGAFAFVYVILSIDPMMAKILGTGVGFAMNYTFRQFVIFERTSRFAAISELRGWRDNHPSSTGPGRILEITVPHDGR